MSALQLLSDCPTCRVEGSVLELLDAAGPNTTPLEGQCRLCGFRTEAGAIQAPGRQFTAVVEVITALERWATDDGEPDVHGFTHTNMNGLTPEQVADRVLRGERVETSFDVIAFLFPQAASGARLQEPAARPERKAIFRPVNAAEPLHAVDPQPESATVAVDPQDIARALVSVMVADGVVRAAEKKFLARTLADWGAPPIPDADHRVWRPQEIGVPADPKRLLQAMIAMSLIDGEADSTEVRILEEYARAWGLPLDRSKLRRTSSLRALLNSIVELFVA